MNHRTYRVNSDVHHDDTQESGVVRDEYGCHLVHEWERTGKKVPPPTEIRSGIQTRALQTTGTSPLPHELPQGETR